MKVASDVSQVDEERGSGPSGPSDASTAGPVPDAERGCDSAVGPPDKIESLGASRTPDSADGPSARKREALPASALRHRHRAKRRDRSVWADIVGF